MKESVHAAMAAETSANRRSGRRFLLLAVLLVVAISAGGSFYFDYQSGRARQAAKESLQTIADLKADEIVNWLKERRGDAEVLRTSAIGRGLLSNPESDRARAAALFRVQNFRRVYGYAAVVFASTNGVLLKDPADYPLPEESLNKHIQAALDSQQVEVADLNRDVTNEPVLMWLECPMFTDLQTNGSPIGAALLVIDPRTFLYPTVKKWPTPSQTAETLLVRREGDSVVFLNDLRFRANAAVNLRFPINGDLKMASANLLGDTSGKAIETLDYRKVPVLAVARKINSTPWIMVVKVDEEEILAPIREQAWSVGIITGLLLVSSVLGMALLWRRQRLADLRMNEARFRTLIEDAPLAVGMSRNGINIYANRKFLEMFGFRKAEELIGRPISEHWAPEYRSKIQQRAEQRARGVPVPTNYDGMAQRKDGSQFPVEVAVTTVNLPDGNASVGFLTDITDRKRNEEILNRLNRELRAISACNQALIRASEENHLLQDICQLICEGAGYRMAWVGYAENDPDKNVRPVACSGVDEGYVAKVKATWGEGERGRGPAGTAIRSGESVYIQDFATDPSIAPWRDGASERGYRSSISLPLKDENGRTFGVLTIYSAQPNSFLPDEVRLLEELAGNLAFGISTLRSEAERKRVTAAIEQSAESVVVTDAEEKIIYVNVAFEKITGYRREEVLGHTPRLFKSGKHDETFYRQMWDAINHSGVWQGRLVNKRKDGKLYEQQSTIMAVRDDKGKAVSYISLNLDVTYEMELEAQLRQAQKMEAVGQLAGGVAHDFNNILAAVMMNLDLLLYDRGLDQETVEIIKELQTEAKRASTLTRQLLMFSRRSVMETRILDLNEVVAGLLKMLGRLLGENIRLIFDRSHALPTVEADAGMLEQVLMNLVVNARDAMPDGGSITITTSSRMVTAEQAKAHSDGRPGQFVCLEVTDTGCGMDEATLGRIFEPFFTTKEEGKGTGLGLATVYGIAAQHKGWVEVKSQVKKGSSFRVFLPTVGIPIADAPPIQPQATPSGQETILLVEDNGSVRRTLVQTLRVLGYRVLESANGQEAMLLWKKHGPEIDLLFTDMIMPEGMTGLELARRVKNDKPLLKVIISSGYNSEISKTDTITAAGMVYLPKPYQIPILGKVVRECLDGK